jgi:hypothetical protein
MVIEINGKEILHCNYKQKKFIPCYSIYVFIYIFSIFGSISLVELEIDFIQSKYNNIILNTVWAATLADEIKGTENADTINGTINKDIIKGLDGNDTLAGKEAGDDISGGSGDDTIYGNEGRDILWGKAGNDRLEGEKGNDRLYGDRGNDVLVGGSGNDTFTGGPGKDVFLCRTGSDTVRDFNITEDTIPENDCEKMKYGNTEYFISLPEQQQEQEEKDDSNPGNINNKEMVDKKNSDSGLFFGLFK